MASTLPRTIVAVAKKAVVPAAKRPLQPSDSAKCLAARAGKALSKPGLSKKSVFGSAPKGGRHAVYAYSVLPGDPTKIVRESFDGTKTIGRVVGGTFRKIAGK